MNSSKFTLIFRDNNLVFKRIGGKAFNVRALLFKVLTSKALADKIYLIKGIFSKVLAIKVAATSLLFALIFIVFSASISAHDNIMTITQGVWLTDTDGSKIATYQKDNKWFGKLVASDNKEAPLGIDVLRNFTFIDGQWVGEIYSIKRDQLADAAIEPKGDKLVIEVSIAFFSKTLEWQNEKSTQ